MPATSRAFDDQSSVVAPKAKSTLGDCLWLRVIMRRGSADADDADDADDARSITGFRPLLCTARRITTSLACFVYARKT
jgi:hypothetical protein